MILVKQIIKHSKEPIGHKTIDYVSMPWFALSKRIQRLQTNNGVPIAIQLLSEKAEINDGDILYETHDHCIVVDLLPCDVLCITPKNDLECCALANEIGNKHTPLFVDGNDLLMPFDANLFEIYQKRGLAVTQTYQKLTHPLNANNSQHGTYKLNKNKQTIALKLSE